MAVESRPQFHPESLRQHVPARSLPGQAAAWQPRPSHWADLIAPGRTGEPNRTALLPAFLTDIFCSLLGYTGPAEAADT